MSGTGFKQSPAIRDPKIFEPGLNRESAREFVAVADCQAQVLRSLWERRPSFLRTAAIGLLALAFLIPKSFTSKAHLMPADAQSAPGKAMMVALAAKTGGDLAGVAGDLLGPSASTQYEPWLFPVIQSNPQSNVTASIEILFEPHKLFQHSAGNAPGDRP